MDALKGFLKTPGIWNHTNGRGTISHSDLEWPRQKDPSSVGVIDSEGNDTTILGRRKAPKRTPAWPMRNLRSPTTTGEERRRSHPLTRTDSPQVRWRSNPLPGWTHQKNPFGNKNGRDQLPRGEPANEQRARTVRRYIKEGRHRSRGKTPFRVALVVAFSVRRIKGQALMTGSMTLKPCNIYVLYRSCPHQ